MKNWKKKRERERKRYIKELVKVIRKNNSQSLTLGAEEKKGCLQTPCESNGILL